MTIALLSRSLIVAAALVVLAACSTVRIAYHGADILIRQYADDYLALDAELAAAWEPQLTQALDRHKAEELPFLASFFDGALRAAERGFDRATVDCLQDQALVIYQRHARLAADLAAPLLASGGPGQLRTLEARFRQDWQEEASAEQLAKVARHVDDARRKGAMLLVGGRVYKRSDRPG